MAQQMEDWKQDPFKLNQEVVWIYWRLFLQQLQKTLNVGEKRNIEV
jgi:hypothetical protein